MSSFTKPLVVEILQRETEGRVQARLLQSFEYYTDEGEFYDVPEGYVTDFASIPRPFWIIFPPLGRYAKSAVVHDYLCDNQRGLARSEVDSIFYDGMIVLDVPKWKAVTMWAAVRFAAKLRGIK